MVGITSTFGAPTTPAFFLYRSLESTREQQFAVIQRDPLIDRDVQYFLENAGEVETVEEFVNDRRLMSVALSAFALDEEINLLGRMKVILTEPPEDEDSLVNKLIDPRFKEIAEAFQFASRGTGRLKLISFRNEVVDMFLTNEFEKRLGQQNPALREAEYFRRKIGDIDGTFDILGDKVLRAVVTFTLGLPQQIALQSVDKQKALIDARIDVEKFKDPEFAEEFIQKFLITKDNEAAAAGLGISTGGGNAHLLPLFQNITAGVNLLV